MRRRRPGTRAPGRSSPAVEDPEHDAGAALRIAVAGLDGLGQRRRQGAEVRDPPAVRRPACRVCRDPVPERVAHRGVGRDQELVVADEPFFHRPLLQGAPVRRVFPCQRTQTGGAAPRNRARRARPDPARWVASDGSTMCQAQVPASWEAWSSPLTTRKVSWNEQVTSPSVTRRWVTLWTVNDPLPLSANRRWETS